MNVHLIHHKNNEEVCHDYYMSIYHNVYLESDVKAKTGKSDKKRPGYCECCGVRFDDFTPVSDVNLFQSFHHVLYCFTLDQHVRGDQHMAYATNPDNFASLDAMYDKYKIPTLEQFVDAHTIRCVDSK